MNIIATTVSLPVGDLEPSMADQGFVSRDVVPLWRGSEVLPDKQC